ncbi:MAG TPA: agenet domain-containing protein [Gemmataceae bacterium]|nr:agenet domain-containing protein [Gemmataceae bacterium]
MSRNSVRRCTSAIVVALCGLWSACASAQELGWKPEKTWVIAVGVLEWKASKLYGGFPKEGRRDAELVEFFRKHGVPEEQVVFLEDKQATLAHIDKAFDDVLPKTKENDLLIIYYAGHGTRVKDATYFANYDITAKTEETGWSAASIIDAVEANFHGSRVLLAADCCYSGGLGVEAAKRKGKIEYAVLTSVQPTCESTGNWTFTESLLQGLNGDPAVDLDGDGRVTLAELARYTETRMAFDEEQLSYFSTANGFDAKTLLAVAAGKPKRPGEGAPADDRVEVEWHDEWWHAHILAVKDGKTLIRYGGYGPEWNEWVGPDRIRAYKPPPEFAAGVAVQVEWGGKWWPAKVLEGRLGLHKVHYDDYGDEWDEWVGPKRIKPVKE